MIERFCRRVEGKIKQPSLLCDAIFQFLFQVVAQKTVRTGQQNTLSDPGFKKNLS